MKRPIYQGRVISTSATGYAPRDGMCGLNLGRWAFWFNGWNPYGQLPRTSASDTTLHSCFQVFRSTPDDDFTVLTQLPDAPENAHTFNCCRDEDNPLRGLVIFSDGQNPRSNMWIVECDNATGMLTWTPIALSPTDTAKLRNSWLSAMVYVNGAFIRIGGYRLNEISNDFEEVTDVLKIYEDGTGWHVELISNVPEFGGNVYNGAYYDGEKIHQVMYYRNQLPRIQRPQHFTSSDNGYTWNNEGDLPVRGLGYSACTFFDGRGLIFEGNDTNGNTNDAWQIDPVTNAVTPFFLPVGLPASHAVGFINYDWEDAKILLTCTGNFNDISSYFQRAN